MNKMVRTGSCCGRLIRVAILVLLVSGNGKACAAALELLDVASGYSACKWVDLGLGTSNIFITVNYKKAASALPDGAKFYSRGIVANNYDKNGVVKGSSNFFGALSMDGAAIFNSPYFGPGYVMYYSDNPKASNWGYAGSFSAQYILMVKNSDFLDWPAISIRAGNYTVGNDNNAGDMSGAAYIRFGEDKGVCEIVKNPEVPPPLDIKIDMTAPDWNLGDLPRDDSEKTFPEVANQLCFTYSGPSVKGRRFIVNASNANGVVGNRYRLKNVSDASQYVPYDVALSGGASFSLPNASNISLTMDDSGKTCFVPTFKTTVDKKVKEGDYSDVLTFTVISQP